MAVSELFVCDGCQADVVLVHAMEWQAGKSGEIIPYPGYGTIGGLANRLWCPECRSVRDYPFVTLNPPGTHAVVAYAEAQRLGCTGAEVGPCPECNTMLTWQVDGEKCSECENGILQFTGEWEDAV